MSQRARISLSGTDPAMVDSDRAVTIRSAKWNGQEITSANADTNNAAAYTALKGVATTRAADTNIYGINEKIILGRTTTIH